MNLERLRIFLAVVEAGTLNAASRRVHLTQPALSRSLKLLEEELNVGLFDRQGRGLVLTEAGRALVPRATSLMKEAGRLQREVQRSAELGYFDVRVGSVDSVVCYLFPHVVEPLRRAYPELCVKLFTGRTQSLLFRVETGELDLAIVAHSGRPPGARVHQIGPYGLQYYGRADLFPELANVTSEGELAHYPMVEIEALPGQGTLIPEGAPSFAVASSLASVKSLILGGFGVGALIGFALAAEERDRLVCAQVPHDPDCWLYVIGSRNWAGGERQAIEQSLVDELRGAVGHPRS